MSKIVLKNMLMCFFDKAGRGLRSVGKLRVSFKNWNLIYLEKLENEKSLSIFMPRKLLKSFIFKMMICNIIKLFLLSILQSLKYKTLCGVQKTFSYSNWKNMKASLYEKVNLNKKISADVKQKTFMSLFHSTNMSFIPKSEKESWRKLKDSSKYCQCEILFFLLKLFKQAFH